MLVAAQFDKKIEQTINDLVYSLRPDLKLFCCGSLEVIAESLMQKCFNCQKLITLMDSKDDEKMWILFILNKKNERLKDRLRSPSAEKPAAKTVETITDKEVKKSKKMNL